MIKDLEKRKDKSMRRPDTDDLWTKIETLRRVLYVTFAIKNERMVVKEIKWGLEFMSFLDILLKHAKRRRKNGVTVLSDLGSILSLLYLGNQKLIKYQKSLPKKYTGMNLKGFCLYHHPIVASGDNRIFSFSKSAIPSMGLSGYLEISHAPSSIVLPGQSGPSGWKLARAINMVVPSPNFSFNSSFIQLVGYFMDIPHCALVYV
jgi:hypothetical protein